MAIPVVARLEETPGNSPISEKVERRGTNADAHVQASSRQA